MPVDPLPDGGLNGVVITEADYWGPLKQAVPAIAIESAASATASFHVRLTAPQSSTSSLELVGPVGSFIDGGALLYGRYPNYHAFFSANRTKDPFDPANCQTDGLISNRLSDQQLRLDPVPGSHSLSANPSPGVTYVSGEPQTYAVSLYISARVSDAAALADRTVRVTIRLNGMDIGRVSLIAFARPRHLPASAALSIGAAGSDIKMDVLTGETAAQVPLFATKGPGIQTQMELAYHSGASGYWHAAAPSTHVNDLVYAPFGHGWSCLYTVRILRQEIETRTSATAPPTSTVTLWLQDMNGALVRLWRSPTASTVHFGVHPSIPGLMHYGSCAIFGVPYGAVWLEELTGGGYMLAATAHQLRLRFDNQGRLTEVRRLDHGRPLTLAYQAAAVTITDAQGRRTIWKLGAQDLVAQVTDPSGGVWRCDYQGHSLMAISHVATTLRYEFDYEPDRLLLTRFTAPGTQPVDLSYQTAGPANRYGAGTVDTIAHGTATSKFQYASAAIHDFTLTVTGTAQAQTVHKFSYSTAIWPAWFEWTTVVGPQEIARTLNQGLQLVSLSLPRATPVRRISHDYEDGRGWRLIRTVNADATSVGSMVDPQNWLRVNLAWDRKGRRTLYTHADMANAANLVETVTHPPAYAGEPAVIDRFAYNADGDLIEHIGISGSISSWDLSAKQGEWGLPLTEYRDDLRGAVEVDKLTYDRFGQVLSHRGPSGETTTYKRDQHGRLTEVTNPDASWERHLYDPPTGHLLKVESSAGQQVEYTYDAKGRIKTETHAREGLRVFEYNDRNLITSLAVDGILTKYTYTALGLVETVSENTPAGTVTTRYVYDQAGMVSEETRVAPEGTSVTTTNYDVMGRVKELILPEITGGTTPWRPRILYEIYEPNDLLKNIRKEVAPGIWETIINTYDGRDRLIKIERGVPPDDLATEEMEYDAEGNLTRHKGDGYRSSGLHTVVRPRQPAQRVLNRDGFGRINGVEDSTGNAIIEVSRDRSGHIEEIRLPDSGGQMRQVERRVIRDGRTEKVSDEFGNQSVIAYDADGRPNLLADPLGTMTRIDYDLAGRPLEISIDGFDGTRSVSRMRYDGFGLVREKSQLRNGTFEATQFVHNGERQLESITDPLGQVTSYTYDTAGNLLTRTEPSGTTKFTYDSLARLTNVDYPTGDQLRSFWDTENRPAAKQNNSARKRYERNGPGRPTLVEWTDLQRAVTRRISLSYDSFDMVGSITDPEGVITSFEWNIDNHLVRVNRQQAGLPVEVIADFERDRQGRVTRQISGNYEAGFFRSATGHLLAQTVKLGSSMIAEIEYSYDALGRRETATYFHLGLVIRWKYDGVGRLIEETVSRLNGGLLSLATYKWDEAGNRLESSINGVRTAGVYNGANQLMGLSQYAVLPIAPGSFSVTADSSFGAGFETSLLTDGIVSSSSAAGDTFLSEATDADHWIEVSFGQPQAVAGLVLSLPADHGWPGELIFSARASAGTSWQPVAVTLVQGGRGVPATPSAVQPLDGRVVVLVPPAIYAAIRIMQPRGAAPPQPADPQHLYALAVSEIELFTTQMNTVRFRYNGDGDGDCIEMGDRSYAYDGDHRLIKIFETNVIDYDLTWAPDGSLLREVDNLTGEAINHLTLEGMPVADYDDAGAVIAKYLFAGPDDPILGAVVSQPGGTDQTHYFWRDALGSIHQVGSPASVLETRVMGAWGEPMAQAVRQVVLPAPAQPQTPFGHAGRRAFDQSDLSEAGVRAYDYSIGRFLTRDPSGTLDAQNRYQYAQGDPVNLVDRNGLFFTHVLGGLASVGVGYVVAKLSGKDYSVGEAAIDFGVGFVSSGLSSIAKCGKLGQTVYRLHQGSRAERVVARAAVVVGDATLGVGADYVHAKAKGQEFDLGTSILSNTLGAAVGSLFTKPYCFPAGTLVATAAGWAPIGSITTADEVLAHSQFGAASGARPVIGAARAEADGLSVVTLQSARDDSRAIRIELTPDHPCYVIDRGWTEAACLGIGDRVAATDGDDWQVSRVDYRAQKTEVFSLHVSDFNTFAVSDSDNGPGIWVHNSCYPRDLFNPRYRPIRPQRMGQLLEGATLDAVRLTKNTQTLRPNLVEIGSPMFERIVGAAPMTLSGRRFRGTIPEAIVTYVDKAKGAVSDFLEIKGGSSVLELTYQLRLQMFMAQQRGGTLMIMTNRELHRDLAVFMREFGGEVYDLFGRRRP